MLENAYGAYRQATAKAVMAPPKFQSTVTPLMIRRMLAFPLEIQDGIPCC